MRRLWESPDRLEGEPNRSAGFRHLAHSLGALELAEPAEGRRPPDDRDRLTRSGLAGGVTVVAMPKSVPTVVRVGNLRLLLRGLRVCLCSQKQSRLGKQGRRSSHSGFSLVVGLSHRDRSNPDATDDDAKILAVRAF